MRTPLIRAGVVLWLIAVGLVVGPAMPAHAVANSTLADWEMNEGVGATTMIDTSGNGIDGVIGSAVETGFV